MKKIAKKMIKILININDKIINLFIMLILVGIMAIGIYKIYESNQIYSEASKEEYISYKPTEDEQYSFSELQEINSEVMGWVTLYGTNIDYPIAQSNDNLKYINTNIEGKYSLAGSIFLDYRNKKDFSDFNSILYRTPHGKICNVWRYRKIYG